MKSVARRALVLAYFSALWMLVVIPAASAYIDPGSGSFLFQGAIAALLAGSMGARTAWRRLRVLFTPSRRGE